MSKVSQTPFLKLSDWVGSDTPERIDFVGDNHKIDEFAKSIKQETLNLQLEKANALEVNNQLKEIKGDYLKESDLPKKISYFENDKGYVTTDELGNIDLSYLERDIADLKRDKANKSYVDAELKGKANVIHNHDSTYSKIGHTHKQYASQAELDSVKTLGVEVNKILVDALNSKDVSASTTDSVMTNSRKVNNIIHATGVAQDYHVLANQTYSNKYGNNKRGSMANVGSYKADVTRHGYKVDIPKGYHDGTGSITCRLQNASDATYGIRPGFTIGGLTGRPAGSPTVIKRTVELDSDYDEDGNSDPENRDAYFWLQMPENPRNNPLWIQFKQKGKTPSSIMFYNGDVTSISFYDSSMSSAPSFHRWDTNKKWAQFVLKGKWYPETMEVAIVVMNI